VSFSLFTSTQKHSLLKKKSLKIRSPFKPKTPISTSPFFLYSQASFKSLKFKRIKSILSIKLRLPRFSALPTSTPSSPETSPLPLSIQELLVEDFHFKLQLGSGENPPFLYHSKISSQRYRFPTTPTTSLSAQFQRNPPSLLGKIRTKSRFSGKIFPSIASSKSFLSLTS
jgi:hypothetical protein